MQHQTLQNLVGRADAPINAGQFDALMDFYCDDATLVVKPGLNACGKAQIRQAFDAIARHFEHSLRGAPARPAGDRGAEIRRWSWPRR